MNGNEKSKSIPVYICICKTTWNSNNDSEKDSKLMHVAMKSAFSKEHRELDPNANANTASADTV